MFGPAARETGVSPDVWRFYLLSIRPENSDAMFSWADFGVANNNILLKNFGNFVNRVVKFTAAKFNSVIPKSSDAPGALSTESSDPDAEFIKEINTLIKEYGEKMDDVHLRDGLETILRISGRGNQYLQDAGLNNALLDNQPERCAQVISRALNLIYVLSVLIEPYMPNTAASILKQLNAPSRAVPDVLALDLLAGHTIGTPELLFKPIDDKSLEAWKIKFGGNAESAAAAAAAEKKPKKSAPKKAAAAPTGPKSAEALEIEAKVTTQGDVVRSLKEKKKAGESVDAELAAAVQDLLKLKSDLETELEKSAGTA